MIMKIKDLQENVVSFNKAPDVGTIVMYKGQRYRVDGWLCEMPPPDPRHHDDFSNILSDILYQSQADHGPAKKKLMFCSRQKAEYLNGHGTAGAIIPLGEFEIVGRVNWSDDMIDQLRKDAYSLVGNPLY